MTSETHSGPDDLCDVSEEGASEYRIFAADNWLTPEAARAKLTELNPHLVIPTDAPHKTVMDLLNGTLGGEY